MKNILVTILSISLTALIIVCMVKGISVGKFEVMSITDIKESSAKLDKQIEDVNTLKNQTYKNKQESLKSSIKNLTSAKQDYLDIASTSTDEEIQKANQEQTYSMEFLWNKVGRYATQEGLTLVWNVSSSGMNKYNLNFSITGSYLGIINYIYAVENDAELAFRIENFKITSAPTAVRKTTTEETDSDKGAIEVATFTVSNIGIKAESINSTIRSTTTTNQDTENSENTTSDNNNTTNTTRTNSSTNTVDNTATYSSYDQAWGGMQP